VNYKDLISDVTDQFLGEELRRLNRPYTQEERELGLPALTQALRQTCKTCDAMAAGEHPPHAFCIECGVETHLNVTRDTSDCLSAHRLFQKNSQEDPDAYRQYPFCRNCGQKVF